MPADTTLHLQDCLDRLWTGDKATGQERINRAGVLLLRLTRKMRHADGRLQRWEETEDVFPGIMLRRCRALEGITPGSVHELLRLAARTVERRWQAARLHRYAARHGERPGR